uniref:Zinc/cadmium resistance protein n=1 Tax=Hirondellea gigas TaxID=1518452 RepID=A0A6A7G8G0_9CRUS
MNGSCAHGDHVHGANCGHTAVLHDNHKGHIVDGNLQCAVLSEEFDADTKMTDGPDSIRLVCVDHQLDNDKSVPCGSPVPCEDHSHGSECGHERIAHGDHFDYLVGDELHHPHDGHCDFHRAVTRDPQRYFSFEDESPPESDVMMDNSRLVRRLDYVGERQKHVPFYKDRDTLRFLIMFILVGGYFFIELIVGIRVHSLALVADALHMLSDFIALCVGFYSLRRSRASRTDVATFGYTRMEVVGGLMNGCFLMAIAFTIVLDAVEILIEHDDNPDLENNIRTLIIVASVGLGVNFLGLFIFGHGHGHGHSHGESTSDSPHVKTPTSKSASNAFESDDENSVFGSQIIVSADATTSPLPKIKNFNIRAVFLHVLGDALGSVAVLVSGFIIAYTDLPNKVLADPICSMVIACIIWMSTIPLVRGTVSVLLQKVPHQIELSKLKKELLNVNGVLEIHELHIWQLNLVKIIGSMHAILLEETDFMIVCDEMKKILHRYGIHSTSIQPEFHKKVQISSERDSCYDRICAAKDCTKNACCAPVATKSPNKSAEPNVDDTHYSDEDIDLDNV